MGLKWTKAIIFSYQFRCIILYEENFMYKMEIKIGKDKHAIENEEKIDANEEELEENSVGIIMNALLRELDEQKTRKLGFENRAGIALTLVGAISVVTIDKIKISEIISRMYFPFDFFDLLFIISGLLFYISYVVSIIFLLLAINSRKYNTIDPKYFSDEFLQYSKDQTEVFQVQYYRDLLLNHQERNDILALQYTTGISSLMVAVLFLVVNMNV